MRNPRAIARWAGVAGAWWCAILGFLLLPALVVTIAAFNEQRDPVVPARVLVAALVRQGAGLSTISARASATA